LDFIKSKENLDSEKKRREDANLQSIELKYDDEKKSFNEEINIEVS
jgi:hypothetical protein